MNKKKLAAFSAASSLLAAFSLSSQFSVLAAETAKPAGAVETTKTAKAAGTTESTKKAKATEPTKTQNSEKTAITSQAGQATGDAYTVAPHQDAYQAKIEESNHTLDTKPWGVAGFETKKANLKSYQGQPVQVTGEASTTRANWAEVKLPDQTKGWVDANAIQNLDRYTTPITQDGGKGVLVDADHTLDTKPWGIVGYRTICSNMKPCLVDEVKINQKVSTTRADWYQISLPDGKTGWIDQLAISRENPGQDQQVGKVEDLNATGTVVDANHTLDFKPWGMNGFATIKTNLNEYLNQPVHISKRVTTSRANWVYITLQDGYKGWTDAVAVRLNRKYYLPADLNQDGGDTILKPPTNVSYRARLKDGHHTLDTRPWGVAGFQTLKSDLMDYQGQEAKVYQLVATDRANWAYIVLPDQLEGWVDLVALDTSGDAFTSPVHPVNYEAVLSDGHHTLDTLPWGIAGFRTLKSDLMDYQGQKVKVSYLLGTDRANWAYIHFPDRLAGWVDLLALTSPGDSFTSCVRPVDYTATLVDGHHTLDTLPWGIPGFRTICGNLVSYQGQNIRVTREVSTNRANWVYIQLGDGKKGWTDVLALKPRQRVLDVPNYLQNQYGMTQACEIFAILQALQAKGYARNESVKSFTDKVYYSPDHNPNNGFGGSLYAWHPGEYNAIYPKALAKWARQFGDVRDISGSSMDQLIDQIAQGNPVVFWTTVGFSQPSWGKYSFGWALNNNHAVTLAGYDLDQNKIFLSDPIAGKYWISRDKADPIYNIRKYAVVVC